MIILGRLLFWSTLAKWVYQELKMVLPQALPYLDSLLQAIALPTHDKWGSVVEHLNTIAG